MGLDMYVYKVEKRFAGGPLSFDDKAWDVEDGVEEIMYWRKHHDLHGWFENLYRRKGGTGVFNCAYVEITLEDLEQLESDIKGWKLPKTTGYFFGNNPPDEQSNEDDLKFVSRARKHLKKGYALYYDSWW